MLARSAWLCCSMLAWACAPPSSPSAEPEPEPELIVQADVEAPEPAPAPDPAVARLAELAVYHDDFVRLELYTWTTVEQLKRARKTKVLLHADPDTGGRASPFNRALMAIPRDGSTTAELARLLLEREELRRHRYAWPSPFATTMGLGPRRYGDSLIRIDLDPRSWFGRFEPTAEPPLSFVDVEGRPVAAEQVLVQPERLAAIYHLRAPPEAPLAYREYVVCSEAMVREWSLATEDIRARVEADARMLDALGSGELTMLPHEAVLEGAAPDWTTAPPKPTPLSLWHASLAFDNRRYQPARARLEAIIATLAGYEDDGGPPLRHRPNGPATASASTVHADL